MSTGFLIYRLRILDEGACKSLTRMLLLVVSPVLIIYSFQLKFDDALLHGLIISAASAVGAHVLAIILARLVFNNHTADDERRRVLRYGTIFSNCGFIGIPLLSSIMGTKGVFYASVYIAVFSFFSWTYGVAIFTGKLDRKALLKIVINPNIIAIVIGLIFFCFSIKIPALLYDSMSYIFNLNTPLAMIVIGARVAQLDLRTVFTDVWIWPGTLLKNILLPLVSIFILHLAGVSGVLMLACLVPIACPVAGNTVLFPDLYDIDTKFASRLICVSTLFSVVTIPLLVYIVSVLKY
jgi:predicted permease